jgi:hypothetical protein
LQDAITALREAGVHAAYNFYAKAGIGFAEHVFEIMEFQKAEQFEEKKT